MRLLAAHWMLSFEVAVVHTGGRRACSGRGRIETHSYRLGMQRQGDAHGGELDPLGNLRRGAHQHRR